MAIAPAHPVASIARLANSPLAGPVDAIIWQAPLVPVALALTTGIVLDRQVSIALGFSLLVAVVGLVSWAVAAYTSRAPGLPLVFLAIVVAALGAAYHHAYRDSYPASDIGRYAGTEPRPVHLRGQLAQEPVIAWQAAHDPLKSIPRPDPTLAVLRVTHMKQPDSWQAVSGRVELVVTGRVEDIHLGDEVEVVGWLVAPQGPANPGEPDQASLLRDQRVRAQVLVRKTPAGLRRVAEGWQRSPFGWLAVLRGRGQRILQESVGAKYSGVAMALLLGEGSTMTTGDWEKFMRTGVIHALAISGYHLVVLGGFLWTVLRLLGVRRRRGAILVALTLLTYALLAGGRPPVLRAAVMVCACCGGTLLRRPTLSANSFALAWLMLAALNPADLFGTGCELSFLAVAVLYWGMGSWFRARPDPLAHMIEQGRPRWQSLLLRCARPMAASYLISAAIWLAAAPLVASSYHLVSPIAIFIAPPVVLLTSAALLSGFLLLLATIVCSPFVPLLAWMTRVSLAGCDVLVRLGERVPGGHWYVGTVPLWWLWIFYGALLSWLLLPSWRPRWHWSMLAGLAWLCVGLASSWMPSSADEMRCTFVAVGHGGCTVLEMPDGRVLLYDAGALGGPEVARRHIAPFLWYRGVRRIDEIFLSHADLDHFNGLPALLERFAVGQVTCTPTFADKSTKGVQFTLASLAQAHVPVRIVQAGDHLTAEGSEIEVLHPPAHGPQGNENTRSLVLRVRHAGHTILLTGDLEGKGLQRLIDLPPAKVDILMAPHHGSRAGNKDELSGRRALVARTEPWLVISCQGPPQWPIREPDPYREQGQYFLGTWPHGAITIMSCPGQLTVESFLTAQRFTYLDTSQD